MPRGSSLTKQDTIAAVATASGRGGVGIVRVSGVNVKKIALSLLTKLPKPRYATYSNFIDADKSVIDQGISLFFPGPNSFTGEDVLELQGHGGPVVLDMLLNRVVSLGARIAQPGEFSERAFLNDKIDLSQAEAIADLIDSASQQAAKGAVRSLQGEFSNKIREIDSKVVDLRMYVEAAIDFPEEEIDFLSDSRVSNNLASIELLLSKIIQQAGEGALLREGIKLVLVGRPNAGKSSLMNQLSGRDSSIVTKIAGTTRDLVNEFIHLDGIPLKLVDTAGIREAKDEVEEEGVRRAFNEIIQADGLLILIDLQATENWQTEVDELLGELPDERSGKIIIVLNKVDLVSHRPDAKTYNTYPVIIISAKEGDGLDALKSSIKDTLVLNLSEEGSFIARARHVNALNQAFEHLIIGKEQLVQYQAGELLAEELRLCHESLCEITGEFTSDDLLGKIFSSFCIGK